MSSHLVLWLTTNVFYSLVIIILYSIIKFYILIIKKYCKCA